MVEKILIRETLKALATVMQAPEDSP